MASPDPTESLEEPQVTPAPRRPFGPRSRASEPAAGLALPPETEEIRAVIERAKQGEAEALNELFARYQGFMVDLARHRLGPKLRQKEDADDLAQTTFREATRDFEQYEYRGEGSFLSWLVQILQNKIRDKAEYYAAGKRDAGRERPTQDTGSDGEDIHRYEPPSDDLSVTQTLEREEEFRILREALEELSADHRKAITLVFFQGLSLREAGQLLDGRSEDAVRMLLRRAESRLRELTRTRLAR